MSLAPHSARQRIRGFGSLNTIQLRFVWLCGPSWLHQLREEFVESFVFRLPPQPLNVEERYSTLGRALDVGDVNALATWDYATRQLEALLHLDGFSRPRSQPRHSPHRFSGEVPALRDLLNAEWSLPGMRFAGHQEADVWRQPVHPVEPVWHINRGAAQAVCPNRQRRLAELLR